MLPFGGPDIPAPPAQGAPQARAFPPAWTCTAPSPPSALPAPTAYLFLPVLKPQQFSLNSDLERQVSTYSLIFQACVGLVYQQDSVHPEDRGRVGPILRQTLSERQCCFFGRWCKGVLADGQATLH